MSAGADGSVGNGPSIGLPPCSSSNVRASAGTESPTHEDLLQRGQLRTERVEVAEVVEVPEAVRGHEHARTATAAG